MELLTIETVGKFGPKVNGVWYGLKKPLKPSDFVAGETYEAETEDWESGTKSGKNIVSVKKAQRGEKLSNDSPVWQKAQESANSLKEDKDVEIPIKSYEENKNRRILVKGIVQAVAQSPSLAGLPFTSVSDVVANIKETSKQLIAFVDEETK